MSEKKIKEERDITCVEGTILETLKAPFCKDTLNLF